MMIRHPIPPVFDKDSEILILGSFPSPVSREVGFFYGNKQNRFWPLMERLFSVELDSITDKILFLHSHHIALWDVVGSCEIHGSGDETIEDVTVNDIRKLIEETRIRRIYTNGQKASAIYRKKIYPDTRILDYPLPSTSPRNAGWNFERLLSSWATIKES